jgi:hypothetical protein
MNFFVRVSYCINKFAQAFKSGEKNIFNFKWVILGKKIQNLMLISKGAYLPS